MATQGLMTLHRKVRNSGTERMSRAMIHEVGTGTLWGAAGVKTAKLCVEQDQIGRHRKHVPVQSFRVGSLEIESNFNPRGMIIDQRQSRVVFVNRIRVIAKQNSHFR